MSRYTEELKQYLSQCDMHSQQSQLDIAIKALKEISAMRYKLTGIETEEAEMARRALESIEQKIDKNKDI